MATRRYHLDWKLASLKHAGDNPERFVPAQVPGAVQLDWASANGIPLPEFAGNVAEYRWMEDSYWLYKVDLDYPSVQAGERAFFICGGVDYQFQVRIDGKVVHEQEGMFTPFEIGLAGIAVPGSSLEILVFPAPKSHHDKDYRSQANRSVKPTVSYGGAEFHPRLIPLGIWEDAWIEVRTACHLRLADTSYRLGDRFETATVQVRIELSQPGYGTIRWSLLDPYGKIALIQQLPADVEMMELTGVVDNPRLWWPNEQGGQDLYTSMVELLDQDGAVVDVKKARIGFRQVKLVMHPTQWDDPEIAQWPIGPNKPPITLEINGRRIFGKGSNWVSPDIFPGRIMADTYKPLLEQAKNAHFNLIRSWGGAIVQKDAFFDQCDEMGLMVWQEFPLSTNLYEGEHYLKVLDQESRSIIRRLRQHACIVLWCGGNELFDFWSRMTDQEPAIRLLNRNTFELDPHRPFINTSPLHGMGHGSYLFNRLDGKSVYEYFPEAHCTAYPEFGVPGPASADYIRRIIPAEELFPPKPTHAWVLRHGMQAWDRSPTSWLEYDSIVKLFGEPESLEQMVEEGQFLQCEGLKFCFEETRRQKPNCALGLSWCFNEPWPASANSSLLSWPALPKPALAAVKAALRPVLASARPAKINWHSGEVFTADLFILNDAVEDLAPVVVEAWLVAGEQEYHLLNWPVPVLISNTNMQGPTVNVKLPDLNASRFSLILKVPICPEWTSTYTFIFHLNDQDGSAP